MTTISLNLQALRGKSVQDAAGSVARIIDLTMDSSKGTIAGVSILTGQGRKIVPMESIKLDYTAITCKVKFDDLPINAS